MSTPFNQVRFSEADWRAAYEGEQIVTQALRAENSRLKRQMAAAGENRVTLARAHKNIEKARIVLRRNNELRRAVAARVLGALLTGRDHSQVQLQEVVDFAVDAADDLLLALDETGTPKEETHK